MAFGINLVLTSQLGKGSQWAWRLPIIIMQVYPIMLFAVSARLPETPRWLVLHDQKDKAKKSLTRVFGEDGAQDRLDDLISAHEQEQKDGMASYSDMLFPSGNQFHPTVITVMGQINQALTGYGAVSVYGPQIFELLGFAVMTAEYLTMGNYLFYLCMMTFAWLLIDRTGRRWLMVHSAWLLTLSFLLLTLLGGLAMNSSNLHISSKAPAIPGVVILYLATSAFGIGWLVPPWLIPTEIYPSSARAQGSAISVIIWGFANFAVTLLTPIGFNNLKYWLFLVFAVTNAFAGWWTWMYCPESGGRSFEENQDFFAKAGEKDSWRVRAVKGGEWLRMPEQEKEEGGERQPLLGGLLGGSS
jgi:Sugar (and other) transporter